MKKGLSIIAGGFMLSGVFFSCQGGGGEEAQKTIDSLNARITFVTDSLTMDCNARFQAFQDSLAADTLTEEPTASTSGTTKPKGSTTGKTQNTTTKTEDNKLNVGQKESSDSKKLDVGQKESTNNKKLDVGQKPKN
ncbi:MAG: hypothetical protein SFW35_10015 [Chitinophagales bacterium]|nr:hypothetical protein [Chitinophagales bacterium]